MFHKNLSSHPLIIQKKTKPNALSVSPIFAALHSQASRKINKPTELMNIFGQYGPMCHRALFHSFEFISISMWIVNALHVISHWCCWIIIILSPFFRHENKMLSLKLSSDNLTIFFSYFGEMCRCMSKTMHTVTFFCESLSSFAWILNVGFFINCMWFHIDAAE